MVDPALDKSALNPVPTIVQPVAAPLTPQANAYGQQPGEYSHQPGQYSGVYAQSPPVYATQAQSQQATVNGGALIKPVGTWGDNICDCTKNLFPSCYCACCVCYGIWLVAQMAEKTGFAKFNTVITVYVIVWTIAFIIEVVTGVGSGVLVWLPFICTLAYTCALRVFIAQRDSITDCGSGALGLTGECCTAFWCVSCSIAQMARYTYGYTQVLDGDGAIHRPDNYHQGHFHGDTPGNRNNFQV